LFVRFAGEDTASVKWTCSILVRAIILAAAVGCATHFLVQAALQSSWNKERLYRKLLSGSPQQQLSAASGLVYARGQKQLLAALKSETAAVRDVARRALEYSWFIAEGDSAFELMQNASKAYDREDYPEALNVLNQLVAKYPRYAEAWNRRACVYWKMQRYEESIADCERTLSLNPQHYGAWQGLGVCKLHLGEIDEAVKCLRVVLRITPHDPVTQSALKRCEDLLRNTPPARRTRNLETV
jgi:tetratricopeptide (TPR) repeat protein